MIWKKLEAFLFQKPGCLYDSWIGIIFAKVLMRSVIGEFRCALRASLLAIWIYSEFELAKLSFSYTCSKITNKKHKNCSCSIRHSPIQTLIHLFFVVSL